MQAEQQPFLDGRAIQVLPHRQALKVISKMHPHLCFLDISSSSTIGQCLPVVLQEVNSSVKEVYPIYLA